MRCPTLSELPPPPPGYSGWPWTEESPRLPNTMPDGSAWPRVSVVTPSYRHAEFIEECIRSVLLQGYPDLEYIVIDDCSLDGSVEVIRKYKQWLTLKVHQQNCGEANTVNEAWRMCTGEIIGWISSDDFYTIEAISTAVNYLLSHVDVTAVYGDWHLIDENSRLLEAYRTADYEVEQVIKHWSHPISPGRFFRRSAFDLVGYLNPSYHWPVDIDYFLRLGLVAEIRRIPTVLLHFRSHEATVTRGAHRVKASETIALAENFFANPVHARKWNYLRAESLSNAYLAASQHYFTAVMPKETRQAILHGWRLRPQSMARWRSWYHLGLSLLPVFVLKQLRQWRRDWHIRRGLEPTP